MKDILPIEILSLHLAGYKFKSKRYRALLRLKECIITHIFEKPKIDEDDNIMNPKKFTYLLGAGASYNSIPTVEGFTLALKELAHFLKDVVTRDSTNEEFEEDILRQIQPMADQIIWLAEEIPYYTSPDTLAKIFFIKGERENLKKLKDVITIFMNCIQFLDSFRWKNPEDVYFKLDPRYINFLATICKNNITFPDNVKIISWNYDFQLQWAAHLIREDKSMPLRMKGVSKRKPGFIEYFPGTSDHLQNLDLIHLNGNASIWQSSSNRESIFHTSEQKITLSTLVELWNNLQNVTRNPFIKFAWEGDENPVCFFKDHLRETNILVIIGYSFPFFNRERDNVIFDFLKESEGIKTIFFQNPNLSGEELYDQFALDKNEFRIKHITLKDRFFVPYEF